jgi:hypothetical protein
LIILEFSSFFFFPQSKGIKIQEKDKEFINLVVENPVNPQQKTVHFSLSNQDNPTELNWPTLFLYPEHGQTDFIESFNENST